jgi:hypothetical protein
VNWFAKYRQAGFLNELNISERRENSSLLPLTLSMLCVEYFNAKRQHFNVVYLSTLALASVKIYLVPSFIVAAGSKKQVKTRKPVKRRTWRRLDEATNSASHSPTSYFCGDKWHVRTLDSKHGKEGARANARERESERDRERERELG